MTTTLPPEAATRRSPRAGGPRPRRRRRLGLAALALLALLAVLGVTGGLASLGEQERDVFPAGAAFAEPIGDDPRLDPDSEAIARLLAEPGEHRVALLHAYGTPVLEAGPTTPRHRLEVVNAGPDGWGDNVLAHEDVPIPAGAVPSAGGDGKLTIIDRGAGKVYDLWQLERDGDGWRVAWGGVYPLEGSGSSDRAMYRDPARPLPNTVPWPEPVSRGTGSGVATLAGLVRLSELEEGVIPHAVAFATNAACGPAQVGEFRWPATTTDGWVTDGPCIPQGARVQLDPSIDLARIPGISKGELALGRALQEYGGYAVDVAGSRMAFGFEAVQPGRPDPYPAAGLEGDYVQLDSLPWESLRVLGQWDGG